MAVCVESYRAWLSTEARTDDITVIVIDVELGRGLRWGASLLHPGLNTRCLQAVGLPAAFCQWRCRHRCLVTMHTAGAQLSWRQPSTVQLHSG